MVSKLATHFIVDFILEKAYGKGRLISRLTLDIDNSLLNRDEFLQLFQMGQIAFLVKKDFWEIVYIGEMSNDNKYPLVVVRHPN